MRDQGHIIPLQHIMPTRYEEQPSGCLPAISLKSIRNRGTIPDGPQPTTSWTMYNYRMHIIAADLGLLSTILVHKRDHGT
jgi:hypothetical protein